MKKIIFLMLITASIFMVSCSNKWIFKSRDFVVADFAEVTPNGVSFKESIGTNWWKGTFEGKPVLLHAVQTVNNYASLDIIFIPNEE
mgnify:CR=1 FL=1